MSLGRRFILWTTPTSQTWTSRSPSRAGMTYRRVTRGCTDSAPEHEMERYKRTTRQCYTVEMSRYHLLSYSYLPSSTPRRCDSAMYQSGPYFI